MLKKVVKPIVVLSSLLLLAACDKWQDGRQGCRR